MKDAFVKVGNDLLKFAQTNPNKCIEVILDLNEGKTEEAQQARQYLIDLALNQF